MVESGPRTLRVRIVEVARALPTVQLEMTCRALEQLPDGTTANQAVAAADGIVNVALQGSMRSLIAAWISESRQTGLDALAWALRSASAMDDWWTHNRRVDVVWTGLSSPSTTFRRTEQALLDVLKSARRELWLVSFAGYKLPDVRDALVAAAERGVAVRMIIESPEESQGKVTFSTLEGLGGRLAEVATVYVWPLAKRPKNEKGAHGSLHVKCALADDEFLFISSANLTEFAMTLNMELGVLARGGELPAAVGRHFRWLVESGTLTAIHAAA